MNPSSFFIKTIHFKTFNLTALKYPTDDLSLLLPFPHIFCGACGPTNISCVASWGLLSVFSFALIFFCGACVLPTFHVLLGEDERISRFYKTGLRWTGGLWLMVMCFRAHQMYLQLAQGCLHMFPCAIVYSSQCKIEQTHAPILMFSCVLLVYFPTRQS